MKPVERIGVWKRNRFGTLVEYICFRELDTGRYWCWGTNNFQPEYFESLESTSRSSDDSPQVAHRTAVACPSWEEIFGPPVTLLVRC